MSNRTLSFLQKNNLHHARLSKHVVSPPAYTHLRDDHYYVKQSYTIRRRIEELVSILDSPLRGARNNKFGNSIFMTDDGMMFASEAPWSSNNGNNNGYIRILGYSNEIKTWEQLGSTIEGADEYDFFGELV